ncbi:ribonuclease P/MRP protein subunit POP5-like [Portunus trituberculatus]|uniref:ribonuclease P/MRP protein subunit POP5-like n=1 Tax=Portunus trituberculatus TaxID=210409 RepID=UPI001E1CD391|nr:ribonuclease P/MRP protein subunit POP5-like [Portunus trituberculatus]
MQDKQNSLLTLSMVRFKRRYVVVEVVCGRGTVRMSALHDTVLAAVKRMHGDYGVGAVIPGFGVKYINPETQIAFISSSRGPHRLVASSLPFISEVGGRPATVRSLHHAASMRHGFIFLKKYNEEKLKELEEQLPAEKREKLQQEKRKALGAT